MVNVKRNGKLKKALEISELDGYYASCFPLHRRVPVRDSIVDGVSYVVDASIFKECNVNVDSHSMIRMRYRVRCETKSVMLHFDSETLPDKAFLNYISYSVRPFVPKPSQWRLEIIGNLDTACLCADMIW